MQNQESTAADLQAVALAAVDFEQASNALLDLKKRHKSEAREAASKILSQHIGDVYYQALAFEVLYAVSLEDAVTYIEVKSGNVNPYLLGAMLDCVTEDAGALESRDKIEAAVSLLRAALASRSKEDLDVLSVQSGRFLGAYR